MNERGLHPANVSAGAALICGTVTLGFPQHFVSVVQVLIVTVAVSAGLYALSINVPPTGWLSPFKWMSPFGRRPDQKEPSQRRGELDRIRAQFAGRRQRIDGGPPLPPATLHLMKPLIRSALDLERLPGLHRIDADVAVHPLTRAMLRSTPLDRPDWLRTVRPRERDVARAVNLVLDDLERLEAGGRMASHL